MDQEIYYFLRVHMQKKQGAFITVKEVYDKLPMTQCVLRHSIDDIMDAIKQNKIWVELNTKCEVKRIDKKYGPMTCFCDCPPVAELFMNIEFDLVRDNHFIKCSCCSSYT